MKQLIQLLSELIERLKSESPDFFKKTQFVAGIAIGILSVILALNKSGFIDLNKIVFIGHNLINELTALNTLLVGVFGTSLLPVKDKTNEQTN